VGGSSGVQVRLGRCARATASGQVPRMLITTNNKIGKGREILTGEPKQRQQGTTMHKNYFQEKEEHKGYNYYR